MSMLSIGRQKIDLIRNQIYAGKSALKQDERGLKKNETLYSCIRSFPSEMSHYSRNKIPNRLYLSPWFSITSYQSEVCLMVFIKQFCIRFSTDLLRFIAIGILTFLKTTFIIFFMFSFVIPTGFPDEPHLNPKKQCLPKMAY